MGVTSIRFLELSQPQARRDRLLLPPHAGFLVVRAPTGLLDDAFLLYALFETRQGSLYMLSRDNPNNHFASWDNEKRASIGRAWIIRSYALGGDRFSLLGAAIERRGDIDAMLFLANQSLVQVLRDFC